MRNVVAGLMAVGMAFAPLGAAALSCLEYSIRNAYWYHHERPETYVLVHGSFSGLEQVDAAGQDLTGVFAAAEAEVWTARFTGFKASNQAFDQPFEAEVTLVFPDFSMIGGGTDSAEAVKWLPGQTGLVWLQRTDAGFRLTAEPCASMIDRDPASVKPALNCLAGRHCPKQE